MVSRGGVPKPWARQRLGVQCEEYPSLVDDVWCTGTENQVDLRWSARAIAA